MPGVGYWECWPTSKRSRHYTDRPAYDPMRAPQIWHAENTIPTLRTPIPRYLPLAPTGCPNPLPHPHNHSQIRDPKYMLHPTTGYKTRPAFREGQLVGNKGRHLGSGLPPENRRIYHIAGQLNMVSGSCRSEQWQQRLPGAAKTSRQGVLAFVDGSSIVPCPIVLRMEVL